MLIMLLRQHLFFWLFLGSFIGFIDRMFLGVLAVLVDVWIVDNSKTEFLQDTTPLYVVIQSAIFGYQQARQLVI